MDRRYGVLRNARPHRELQYETNSPKSIMEGRFLSFTGGKRQIEFRSLRYLLKGIFNYSY